MKPIPKSLRATISEEMETAKCARLGDGICSGRITVEHAFGRVKQPKWSLIYLCWYHHLGKGLNKQKNKWLALRQATDDDLKEFKNYQLLKQEKTYLEAKYGTPGSKRSP